MILIVLDLVLLFMPSRSCLSVALVSVVSRLEAIDRRVASRRRLITHDDTLVHEAKNVFRYLLATVIRRLQNVRDDS